MDHRRHGVCPVAQKSCGALLIRVREPDKLPRHVIGDPCTDSRLRRVDERGGRGGNDKLVLAPRQQRRRFFLVPSY